MRLTSEIRQACNVRCDCGDRIEFAGEGAPEDGGWCSVCIKTFRWSCAAAGRWAIVNQIDAVTR